MALPKLVRDKIPEIIKIKRFNHRGIVVEYIDSSAQSDKAIILLDGLPSVPHCKDLMYELNRKGYSVFFPRYRGTWESEGDFLSHSPVKDIEDIISFISRSDQKGFSNIKEINIIGTSFGGGVALCLKPNDLIKNIICLSPVLDFKQVNGIETLYDYLNQLYSGAYRFSHDNWLKLLNNEIINPSKLDYLNPNKYFLLGGREDLEVKSVDLAKFGSSKGINVKIYNCGHISLSKIKDELAVDILNRLNS